MKKMLVACACAILIAGCSSKEQTGLKETLVEKFKDDQDLKDYNLDPEVVADCVVNEIAASLPGFAGDPRRDRFFDAYARFYGVKTSSDAEKAITEFQELFGSAREAREAAANMSNHIMTCMGIAIANSEVKEMHHPAAGKTTAPEVGAAPAIQGATTPPTGDSPSGSAAPEPNPAAPQKAK